MSEENNNKNKISAEIVGTLSHNASNGSPESDPTEEYLSTFPPGYRFAPTDAEILVHYLTTKVENRALPVNKINEVNIYDHIPEYLTSDIFKSYEDVWYYYTSRDRKYRNGERPSRSAGDGYWKATGVDKKIKSSDGTHLGSKKTLVFYRGKAPKGTKTDWIMHEFRVEQSQFARNSRADMLLDNYVLCRIHNKSKTKQAQTQSAAAAAAATPAHEEATPSTKDEMEEEEDEGALGMITDEQAAAEVGSLSPIINYSSMMETFPGSTFDDPLPMAYLSNIEIDSNYICPTSCAIDPYDSSHMQWGSYWDSQLLHQNNLPLDYNNDIVRSLSVNQQIPHPPMQCGSSSSVNQQTPHPPLYSDDRDQKVFRENDNIFAAGWNCSNTPNVIPNYCQNSIQK